LVRRDLLRWAQQYLQMADNIHTTLAAFRDTVLTAIARLEFQLRDSMTGRDLYERSTILSEIHGPDMSKHEANIQELFKRIDSLERRITEQQRDPVLEREFMDIRPSVNTRNILVPSVRSTPALAAAVAAASAAPPEFELNSETSSESSEEADEVASEEVASEEVASEEEEAVAAEEEVAEEKAAVVEEASVEENAQEEAEEEPELKPITIKKVQYYIDSENNLYSETEDGYEQVGLYDPETKTINPVEEEESEDEGVEVEDFEYKGKTYQRDAENNVYLDGEQVGTWNGKKIVPN
jgi:hypothetical protein